jgi:hypothetical protein
MLARRSALSACRPVRSLRSLLGSRFGFARWVGFASCSVSASYSLLGSEYTSGPLGRATACTGPVFFVTRSAMRIDQNGGDRFSACCPALRSVLVFGGALERATVDLVVLFVDIPRLLLWILTLVVVQDLWVDSLWVCSRVLVGSSRSAFCSKFSCSNLARFVHY